MKILLSLILLFSGVLLAGENTAVLPVKIAYATSHEKQTSDGKFFPWVAFDGDEKTRWASDFSDPQVLMADLGQMAEINKVIIKWETAAAKSYTIDISLDNKKWITVYKTYNGQGNTEEVTIKPIKVRYIRMFGMSRLTGFGYSIFEFKIYGKPLSAHAIKIDLDKSEQKDLVVSKRGDPELLQLPYMNSKLPIEKRIEDLLNRMSLEEKIIQVAGTGGHETSPNIRLGIPEMKVSDGPNGINCKINTAFPTGVTMGATWDPELINQVGIALGEDAKASGIDILLGPCINIHRIPLGGRNFESYSEDPYLVSRIVVPYVKGLQSQKVAASTKHFACNNQEWERGSINVEIDDRTLNEIYLPGFKAAVMEAGTLTVMGAYNKVNGYYCCENKILLEDILKKSWGFKGLVMSDWGATHSTINSANNGLDLEMPGPGQFFGKPLLEAVKNGEISESVINDKVSRILRVMFELGKFDNIRETVHPDLEKHRSLARKLSEEGMVLLKNQDKILPLNKGKIRSIAVIGPNVKETRVGGGGSSLVTPDYSVSPWEGIKNKCNNNIHIDYAKGCYIIGVELMTFPSDLFAQPGQNENIGFKGEYFDNADLKGKPVVTRIDNNIDFNWDGSPDPKIGPDNFSVRWTGQMIPIKTGMCELGLMSDDGSRLYIDDQLIIDNWGDHGTETKTKGMNLVAGKKYNIRIEYYDRGGGAVVKFGHTPDNDEAIKEATDVASKSDIAIVIVGFSPSQEREAFDRTDMNLPKDQDELIDAVSKVNKNTIVVLNNGSPVVMEKWINKVQAVIEAWYLGEEGGNALANILFGDINPSGKLPVTFPKKLEDSPSFKNYPGVKGNVNYAEGIYIGYRYFDKNNVEPLFPFGYGLSYTEFSYTNLQMTPITGAPMTSVKVSLDVRNIGKVEGKEIVQLYIHQIQASLDRPVKELKAFKKITLKPNEKMKVEFTLNDESFSYYNPEKKAWGIEPGKFQILAGSSSRDIRLEGDYILAK